MSIDQVHTHRRSGAAAAPGASTPEVRRSTTEGAAAPVATSVSDPMASRGRRRAATLVIGVLGLLALAAGFALAFLPYDRVLVGYLEGSRTVVEAQCAAPVSAAFGSGDRTLVDGSTWTDGPPCGHSAVYRLGLGGLLALTGVAAVGAAGRRTRRPDGVTPDRR